MIADALVVGGGPAGSSAASLLARAGLRVVLLERTARPTDKVCGEFLSSDAARHLAALGIDLPRLGAVPIDRVRLVHERKEASTILPFEAWGLSRRVLDEALLEVARGAGVVVRRGADVQALVREGDRWTARCRDRSSSSSARALFLATGKHDVRSFKRPPGTQNDLVAFKLHLSLSRAQARELSSTVELFLFEGGYAGLQTVEAERQNLCLLIERRRLRALGGDFERVLESLLAGSPLLTARLRGAVPHRVRPLALSGIPYGLVRTTSHGPFLLGDQAAVIPSFSGDGVAMALYGAALAAQSFLAGRTVAEFQAQLASDVTRGVRLATHLSRAFTWRPTQRLVASLAHGAPFLMRAVAERTRVEVDVRSARRNGCV